MKKIAAISIALCILAGMTACETPKEDLIPEPEATSAPVAAAEPDNNTASSVTPSKSGTSGDTAFTNEYGTAATKCAHSGCENPVASSGDTNCCTIHSNKCAKCGRYIDEDATWCMNCISSALSGTSKGSSSSASSSSSEQETYYCMGKNNTCPNKTYSPWDFYCSSCDPDGDNKEG